MERQNKNESKEQKNAGIHYQDESHPERQENNTSLLSGQLSKHNTISSINEMNNTSEEQQKGGD